MFSDVDIQAAIKTTLTAKAQREELFIKLIKVKINQCSELAFSGFAIPIPARLPEDWLKTIQKELGDKGFFISTENKNCFGNEIPYLIVRWTKDPRIGECYWFHHETRDVIDRLLDKKKVCESVHKINKFDLQEGIPKS